MSGEPCALEAQAALSKEKKIKKLSIGLRNAQVFGFQEPS